MKITASLVLGASLTGLSAPALADIARDARCQTVFAAAMYQADDQAEKGEILPFVLYYTGKVQGAVPSASIEGLLRANVPPLNDAALREAMGPCMEWMAPALADMEASTKFIDDAVGRKPQ